MVNFCDKWSYGCEFLGKQWGFCVHSLPWKTHSRFLYLPVAQPRNNSRKQLCMHFFFSMLTNIPPMTSCLTAIWQLHRNFYCLGVNYYFKTSVNRAEAVRLFHNFPLGIKKTPNLYGNTPTHTNTHTEGRGIEGKADAYKGRGAKWNTSHRQPHPALTHFLLTAEDSPGRLVFIIQLCSAAKHKSGCTSEVSSTFSFSDSLGVETKNPTVQACLSNHLQKALDC